MNFFARVPSALLIISLALLLPTHSTFAQDSGLPTQAQVDEVFELANHHPDANVRKAAVDWLLAVGAPSVPGFMAALGESKDFERDDMSSALSHLGAVAVPGLTEALAKDSVPLLEGAAKVLGEVGPEAAPATAALAKLLAHGEPGVRFAAADALGKIGPGAAEAIPALVAALTAVSSNERNDLLKAIGLIGAKPDIAIPALTAALKDPEQVHFAAEALAPYGPAAAHNVPTLLKLAGTLDPKTQHDAYICVLRAIYFLKPDSMPSMSENIKMSFSSTLGSRKPGQPFKEYSIEKDLIPDLETAGNNLDEVLAAVASFKENKKVCGGTLTPAGIEWEILRTQIASEQEGANQYDYTLSLKDSPQYMHLVTANEVTENGEVDYAPNQVDPGTFSVQWINPPDVLVVSWSNEPEPGSGCFTHATHKVFVKFDSDWKDVYTTEYLSFAKAGVAHHTNGTETLEWSPKDGVLKITNERTADDDSSYHEPLSTAKTDDGYQHFVREVKVTTTRLFQLKDEKLLYIGGKRAIDPGPGTFKLSDVPAFFFRDSTPPEQTIARLRRLNPKLDACEEFQGALIVDINVPERDEEW